MKRLLSVVFAIVIMPGLLLASNVVRAAGPRPVSLSPVSISGLPDRAVTALSLDANGGLWAGTFSGLAHFDGRRWQTFKTARAIGTPWISALLTDRQGHLWAGTLGDGLYRRDGNGWQAAALPWSEDAPQWITALAADNEGRVWAGTFGGGVASFNGTTWTRYPLGSGLPNPWVQTLAADRQGYVWAGTWEGGLSRFDGRTWRTYTVADGLPDNQVNALLVGGDGTLWVGTNAGMAHFDGRQWQTFTVARDRPPARITALAAAPDGTIWAGTPRGLTRFRDGQFSAVWTGEGSTPPAISALAVSAQGTLWIGTLRNGLFRLGDVPSLAVQNAHRPVVLIHGWHGPASDLLADSQLKFLARWLRADGYPVFYATDITAARTLDENARMLQQTINRARRATGASRVHLIGHSMGGLVARAYVESDDYAGDVASVIMLGTPNGGLSLWYSQVARWLREGRAEPSLIELTPEFMAAFNATHRPPPPPAVPYLLLAGDLTGRVDVLRGWPANDGLIRRDSVFAVPGVHVSTDDAHGWTDETILYDVPAYTWPRRTYDRYVRPWLNDCDERSGSPSCAAVPPTPRATVDVSRLPPHTPMLTRDIAAGTTLTLPITLDPAGAARFLLTWDSGDLHFRLVTPGGKVYDGEQRKPDDGVAYLRLRDPEVMPFALYRVVQPLPGRWLMVVENRGTVPAKARVYALPEDGQTLAVSTTQMQVVRGKPVTLQASWTMDGEPVRGGTLVAEVAAEGGYRSLSLADDGRHDDGQSNDGLYAAQFVPSQTGYQTASVTARRPGMTPRVQEVIFRVFVIFLRGNSLK